MSRFMFREIVCAHVDKWVRERIGEAEYNMSSNEASSERHIFIRKLVDAGHKGVRKCSFFRSFAIDRVLTKRIFKLRVEKFRKSFCFSDFLMKKKNFWTDFNGQKVTTIATFLKHF